MDWIICGLPSKAEVFGAFVAASLLILSFPSFEVWFLSWLALIPLLLVIARQRSHWITFIVGWVFGSVFFYGSCYWLTYSMVHFGGIPRVAAFVMLVPGAVVIGIFPGLFATILAGFTKRWGWSALLLAPFIWTTMEWARLGITGQLWNAIGYSLAFHPNLIQPASFGGVYAVGFLIVAVNSILTFAVVKRSLRSLIISITCLFFTLAIFLLANKINDAEGYVAKDAVLVAIQPNVPMDLIKSTEEMVVLNKRHFDMSEAALNALPDDGLPRILVWPESPMNFTYGTDSELREKLMRFAKKHHTSILLNSQEVAPNEGLYNSAVLVNQEGSLVAQYDKIRLLPFGEYVPLPPWLPGATVLRGMVGDFTPGTNYRLMDIGNVRIGVFICIESAYPGIAREFAREGADVLINISNDGYLGPTAVRRQHLSNAVFRAVETGRPVVRVTNTGITANISAHGDVGDPTQTFSEDVRVWKIAKSLRPPSMYARYGDLFAWICSAVTLLGLFWSFKSSPKRSAA